MTARPLERPGKHRFLRLLPLEETASLPRLMAGVRVPEREGRRIQCFIQERRLRACYWYLSARLRPVLTVRLTIGKGRAEPPNPASHPMGGALRSWHTWGTAPPACMSLRPMGRIC